MIKVDLPIMKVHWEPFYKAIVRAFARGDYENVSRCMYKIVWQKCPIYIYAKKIKGTYEIYGWMLLTQKPRWQCWEVAQSFVFEEFRGMGIGKKIYHGVLNDGVLLASGHQQSQHGRRMWRSLIKEGKYHIWAHDFNDTDIYAPVAWDEEEQDLYSPLVIYDRYYWSSHDIRLMARK